MEKFSSFYLDVFRKKFFKGFLFHGDPEKFHGPFSWPAGSNPPNPTPVRQHPINRFRKKNRETLKCLWAHFSWEMGVSDYTSGKLFEKHRKQSGGAHKKRNPDPDRYLFFSFVSFFSGSISRERRRMLLAAVWHQRRKEEDGPMTHLGEGGKRVENVFFPPFPTTSVCMPEAPRGNTFSPGAKLFLFRAKSLKNLSTVYVTKCNTVLSCTLKFGNLSFGIRRRRQHKKGANFIGPPLLISRPAHISPLF